jgi:hypothetical protein
MTGPRTLIELRKNSCEKLWFRFCVQSRQSGVFSKLIFRPFLAGFPTIFTHWWLIQENGQWATHLKTSGQTFVEMSKNESLSGTSFGPERCPDYGHDFLFSFREEKKHWWHKKSLKSTNPSTYFSIIFYIFCCSRYTRFAALKTAQSNTFFTRVISVHHIKVNLSCYVNFSLFLVQWISFN